VPEKCEDCGGKGVQLEERTVSVEVPAGVDNGMLLRLRGEGEPSSSGGPPGDLRVVLHVSPSEIFERDGAHLHLEHEISFVEAALGAEIEVPTLGEPSRLEVKPGTQYGDYQVLQECGVPRVNAHGRGNLYVHFKVMTPGELDDEQRALLEQLAEVSGIRLTLDDEGDPHESVSPGKAEVEEERQFEKRPQGCAPDLGEESSAGEESSPPARDVEVDIEEGDEDTSGGEETSEGLDEEDSVELTG
jgi:DnaJ-class molecular chaperone